MGRFSPISYVKRKVKEQLFQERAFVAFKIGLAVSLGTLLSLTPGYAALWYNPVSLADQCIFTVLGGANLTVGGATEQLFWRFVLGAAAGAAVFSALGAVGGAPTAQGILFFIFVFFLTIIRVKVRRSDIGLTFATLACVYAVDDSYRAGNVYHVDGHALRDLMRSWAFGAAISMTVNILVLPVKASSLARDRTVKALHRIRSVTGWLLCEQGAGHDSTVPLTPATVRRGLHADGETISQLQAQLCWELGWSASNLAERAEITEAVMSLQRSLVVASRDGPFVSDLPEDLATVVRPAVTLFSNWALVALDDIVDTQKRHHYDIEAGASMPSTAATEARNAFNDAAHGITDAVLDVLKSDHPTVERLASLDRATHCLDTTVLLTDDIARLERLVTQERRRKARLQYYIFRHISTGFKDLFGASRRSQEPKYQPLRPPTPSFLPPVSRWQRILHHVTSGDARYAFKVSAALSCLLAILWAPTSRSFFLNFAVRNSTVPLLLALMPNLGLSVFSWTGQLGGAVLGTLWACFSLRVWLGVGKQAYCVPGLFFFEWFLCLAVGWRMLDGPDFLAVTSMNACAIFINVQWQLTGTPGEQSLQLHLGYMLTTAAIAIALAIPFQLLIFPKHARDELRNLMAQTLRRLSHLALDHVFLSSAVLLTEDSEIICAEVSRLKKEVAEIKASTQQQDGLVEMAAAEWGSYDGFQPKRAQAMVEAQHRCADTMSAHIGLCSSGPMDVRIRSLLSDNNERAAHSFAEACSTTFWCLAASLMLLDCPPAPLPSVDDAGTALMRELQRPLVNAGGIWDSVLLHEDALAQGDFRRWWSLTLTLVTQRAEIRSLVHIANPTTDLAPCDTKTQ